MKAPLQQNILSAGRNSWVVFNNNQLDDVAYAVKESFDGSRSGGLTRNNCLKMVY